MKSHRQFLRRLRSLAIGLAVIGALVPAGAASALADPGSSPAAEGDADLRPIPSLSAKQYADAYDTAPNAATKAGDTPADFPGATRAPGVGLNAPAKVGDTPADFPGASRAPDVAPPTIEVVRPERTIVRDVNQALPIALSGAALLIVLMGAAFLLVRVRLERRHAVGRLH
jgi:hypothetical protein